MTHDPLTWLPGSFYRSPAWRWRRAVYLADTGRRPDPRIDDDWVVAARAVLRGANRRGPAAAALRAARDVWAADGPTRWALEARLLTAEPVARVAATVGLSAAVVEAFAAVFFAVREARRATDWLLSRAVGYSAARGFTAALPGAAWRLAAHLGGPLVLDTVIAATTDGPLPAGLLAPLRGAERAHAAERLRRRARLWVAAMGAVTAAEVAAVARERRRLRGAAASQSAPPRVGDPVDEACERLLLAAARSGGGDASSDVGLAGADARSRPSGSAATPADHRPPARPEASRAGAGARGAPGTRRKVG